MLKFFEKLSFKSLAILLGVMLLPALIVPFGAHTDGFLITARKWDWLGYPEAQGLFALGRPLGAILASVVSWFVNSVYDFSILRFLLFVMMLWLCYLMYGFCVWTLRLQRPWASIISFCTALLPINIVNIIWVSNGIQEWPSIISGFYSFLILEKAWGTNRPRDFLVAAGLFLAAIFIYPPTAMLVFALLFMNLLFSKKQVWRGIAFYCFFIAAYWLAVKCIFVPWAQKMWGVRPAFMPVYRLDIAADIWGKGALIVELLRYAWAGTLDVFLHFNKILEWRFIQGFGLVGLIIGLLSWDFRKILSGQVFQRCITGFALFVLANLPLLMAVHGEHVMGYRLLLPASLMGLVLIIAFFRFACCIQKPLVRSIAFGLFIVYFLSVIGASMWMLCQSVRNYATEYRYLDRAAQTIDYTKTNKIVVGINRPGETVIDAPLPFEMGLMATSAEHVRYIFDRYVRKAGKSFMLIESQLGWPVYKDEYTYLVDLQNIRGKSSLLFSPRREIQLQALAMDGAKVLIEPGDWSENFPTFSFKQIKDGQQLPYWQIGPLLPFAGVEIEFIKSPEAIAGYKMDILGAGVIFVSKLQGSHDRLTWEDLPQGRSQTPFKYARLLIFKQNPKDTVLIKSMQVISFLNEKYP